VAEFKPDIVLLNLGLSRMDDYEGGRAIPPHAGIGPPGPGRRHGLGRTRGLAALETGREFDEHLTKPVDISMIELLLTT